MWLLKVIILALMSTFSFALNAQSNEIKSVIEVVKNFDHLSLSPFERAVCCIKYYEGIHTRKNYPYIGYGHQIQPGEKLSYNLSLKDADRLLRDDLQKMCALFRDYGKDSLLLGTLAYNVGPYRILGNSSIPKSNLLKKIKNGSSDFISDYISFCHYKGRKIASIERRRWAELLLLYFQ